MWWKTIETVPESIHHGPIVADRSNRTCCQKGRKHPHASSILNFSSILWLVLQCQHFGGVRGERGLGGSILVPMTLDRQDTPYLVLEDIVIEETGELTIRPGVKLLFAPTVGITVFGRLIAEVM